MYGLCTAGPVPSQQGGRGREEGACRSLTCGLMSAAHIPPSERDIQATRLEAEALAGEREGLVQEMTEAMQRNVAGLRSLQRRAGIQPTLQAPALPAS